MKITNIPSSFFERKRRQLISLLPPKSVLILHSNDEMPRSGDQCFPFRQNSDLFYLTGLDQPESALILCPDHPEPAYREIGFIKKNSELNLIWNGFLYTQDQATQISGIRNIQWMENFDSVLRTVMCESSNVFLNSNEHPKFQTHVPYKDIRFANIIKSAYPTHQYHRATELIYKMRTIKEYEEIEIIKKACQVTSTAFQRVLKKTGPNIMECEIEAEITHEFIRNKCTHAYAPIIASGLNSCILHYTSNDAVCQDGDLLLLDFGAENSNYASDLTRTIPVNGNFTPRQRQCYDAVLRVYDQIKKMYIPGNTIEIINNASIKLMEEELIRLGLFTQEEVNNQPKDAPLYRKYFMHGTAHFMGLDVHDVGNKQLKFEEGMILTCEPGLYIWDERIGIRIETDMIVANNPIDLFSGIPSSADEIEEAMR